jgi:hypothetical protein
MKFGKQLLLRVQPGLEGGYIDYKECKHMIKACVGQAGAGAARVGISTAPPVG